MEKRSETFGRLLRAGMAAIAAIEGKAQQAVEADLGRLLGVAGATLQRYKSGHRPPEQPAIELLAEACVQRGLLGRQWLERFLEAGRMPAYSSRAFAARLFPEAAASHTPVTRPNLPPPTYARFIMREPIYQALVDGLASDLPVTLIVSLGGMGKTSVARAVAGDCLEAGRQAPRFAAAVWVSDKDRPGTTNLSVTLDEIARVLDYPGLVALSFADRQREVERLLRRQPVLLVVDNAETITDDALLDWLGRVPSPSRALVTSRFALPRLAGAYLVDVGPMAAHETRALIAEWLPRSRLRGGAGDLDLLMPVAEMAGGNPKAIELALGLLQHRSRDEVIEDLRAARAELFDELFDRAWELLDGAGQRALLTLPFFPGSASAEALAYCADLSSAAFLRSAEQLADLSLIDVERDDLRAPPRYNAHALVRAYARARLAQLPAAEQGQLRERWLRWCADTALAVGFCWDNLDRLDTLDREYEAIQAALGWAAERGHDAAVIALAAGLRYYYNVRGLWGEETLRNHERRAAAARRLADRDNEILALAHLAEILSKQGRTEAAAATMARLAEVGEALYRERLRAVAADPDAPAAWAAIRQDAIFEYGHALALFARAQGDTAAAEAHWRELLGLAQALGGQKYVVNRRWLATVLLQQGALAAARALYVASLEDARRIGDTRSLAGNTLKLAVMDLGAGSLEVTAAALGQCREIAARHRDRRRLAECHMVSAQLMGARGDRDGAQREFRAALDLFERLGMQREAREAGEAIG